MVKTIVGRQRTASSSSKYAPFRIGTTPVRPQRQFVPSFTAMRSIVATSGPLSSSISSRSARWLSTEIRAQTAAAAAANAAMAEASSSEAVAANTKKKNEPNVFLDNLGKIFLMAIATVIITLMRSSYNTSNRHLVRDRLEEIAAIDPKEIEEFREANSELTLETFRRILSIYYQEFAKSSGGDSSGPTSSYGEFVFTIRKIMATRFPEKGESFTIEMGHYLDRIVVDVLQQRGPIASTGGSDELPVALFFTTMASAMNGSVSDRIRILHELLVTEERYLQRGLGAGGSDTGADSVPIASVRAMVGYLQDTCQLPPDTQIVPTERKYPTQLWRRATPDDMVPDTGSEPGTDAGSNGTDEMVDLVGFAAILRTKSVCAWGECYMKWKPGASEFDTGAPPNALPPGSGN